MRIWDIVDHIFPGVQIVEMQRSSPRFGAVASSAVECAFAIGLVVATSGTFAVRQPTSMSSNRARTEVAAADVMAPDIAATLSAMRNHKFGAEVPDQEPEDEQSIGYSYPT